MVQEGNSTELCLVLDLSTLIMFVQTFKFLMLTITQVWFQLIQRSLLASTNPPTNAEISSIQGAKPHIPILSDAIRPFFDSEGLNKYTKVLAGILAAKGVKIIMYLDDLTDIGSIISSSFESSGNSSGRGRKVGLIGELPEVH